MESDEAVREGFLLLPPSGKLLKKTWQKRFCQLYERSSSGIARLEIYENSTKSGQPKIITLEDVIKISPKNPTTLNIVTKNSDMDLSAQTSNELNDWLEDLKRIAFSDESSRLNCVEQENDLYCSTDDGMFCVKLHPSEASQRCGLTSKDYMLVITSASIQLRNLENKTLFIWPFSFIRKYGFKGGKFTFEAGRKCATGEGAFYLEHPNHDEIYRCVSNKMKNMKKHLNLDPITSASSLIDCSDPQLHAALAMEAGSRNPLPVSFESSSSLHMDVKEPPPRKPPRKTLLLPALLQNQAHGYSHIELEHHEKYETVKNRVEAWKTLGVSEPPHSEKADQVYSAWGSINKSEVPHTAPAVITEPVGEDYDCLQHFGSTTTLKANASYKTVPHNRSVESLHYSDDPELYSSFGTLPKSELKLLPRLSQGDDYVYDCLNFNGQVSVGTGDYKQLSSPTAAKQQSKNDLNLYEEVGFMEPARSAAQDAHLGYGRIKKDSKVKEEPTVSHQFQNDQPYAMISKPKRV